MNVKNSSEKKKLNKEEKKKERRRKEEEKQVGDGRRQGKRERNCFHGRVTQHRQDRTRMERIHPAFLISSREYSSPSDARMFPISKLGRSDVPPCAAAFCVAPFSQGSRPWGFVLTDENGVNLYGTAISL